MLAMAVEANAAFGSSADKHVFAIASYLVGYDGV